MFKKSISIYTLFIYILTILCIIGIINIVYTETDVLKLRVVEQNKIIEKQRMEIGNLKLQVYQLKKDLKWVPVLDEILSDYTKLELDIIIIKKKQKLKRLQESGELRKLINNY